MDAVKELAEDLGEVAEGALDAYLEGEDGVEDHEAPANSQYTRRWWLALKMAFGIFVVATKTPIKTLCSLAVVDQDGVVVTGDDGSPIRPFAVYDPEAVAEEFQSMTLELLVYSDPEEVAR